MKILGLMAGTSLDGIDAALCEIEGSGSSLRVQLLGFGCIPYDEVLKSRLTKACSNKCDVREVARLNVAVGEAFGEAANSVMEKFGRAEVIGSHGQTIAHLPSQGATLQIGEAAIIAEKTGATVVCDFRPRDMALGGQGAPLVPYVDWVLLRDITKNRVALNIGGIANCTILPANCDLSQVRAWDTGPGNMIIDAITQNAFDLPYDENGGLSAKGSASLSENWTQTHPFFTRTPPKSAGREEFGQEFSARFWDSSKTPEDNVASATLLTARSIADSIHHFSGFARGDYELLVGGGGVYNRTLMKMLADEIEPAKLIPMESMGMRSDAKEALAFAILASETLRGVPTNVPSATGARRAAVLGKIVPGENFSALFPHQ